MAKQAVATRGASIRQACADFAISETCYRYQPKLSDENALIADWLVRLTYSQKNWGFGLCFLHLRNVTLPDLNTHCCNPRQGQLATHPSIVFLRYRLAVCD